MSLGLDSVVRGYLETARKTFGVFEGSSPSLPGPVPRASAAYLYNHVAIGLSKSIGVADELAPLLAGETSQRWSGDRRRYFRALAEVFGQFGFREGAPFEGPAVVVERDLAEKFWLESLRVAIAINSLRGLPSDAAVIGDALDEAAAELPGRIFGGAGKVLEGALDALRAVLVGLLEALVSNPLVLGVAVVGGAYVFREPLLAAWRAR